MERLKKCFLLLMQNDPKTAKVFLYHARVKANINSFDELFKDEYTFRKALIDIFGHEGAELFLWALNKYSSKLNVIAK